jgi:DNA-3-methyladenine glycosylase II
VPAPTLQPAMWFNPKDGTPDWSEAIRHLSRTDPCLKRVIKRVGPCTLHPRRDYYIVLCQSIFTQQISTKVAAVLFGRFRDLFPQRRPTPTATLKLLATAPEETIRSVGLSRQKRSYIENLARHFVEGKVPLRRFGRMSDEEIIDCLTDVKGIGRWTVEMFLIFVLNRPDVLPIDDLGLREAVKRMYRLEERPTPKQVLERAEPWRPWRTIATWYLWRGSEGDDAGDW